MIPRTTSENELCTEGSQDSPCHIIWIAEFAPPQYNPLSYHVLHFSTAQAAQIALINADNFPPRGHADVVVAGSQEGYQLIHNRCLSLKRVNTLLLAFSFKFASTEAAHKMDVRRSVDYFRDLSEFTEQNYYFWVFNCILASRASSRTLDKDGWMYKAADGPLGMMRTCLDDPKKGRRTLNENLRHRADLFELQKSLCSSFLIGVEEVEVDANNGECIATVIHSSDQPLEHVFPNEPVPTHLLQHVLQVLLDGVNVVHCKGGLFRSLSARHIVMCYDHQVRVSTAYVVPLTEKGPALDALLLGHYLSPESKFNHTFSAASDVWCIGLCALRMFTGEQVPTFDTREEAALVRTVAKKRLEQYGCPSSYCNFVLSCLQDDSSLRATVPQLSIAWQEICSNGQLLPLSAESMRLQYACFSQILVEGSSAEFADLRRALRKNVLKSGKTSINVELISAKKIRNTLLFDQHQKGLSDLGNPTVGFFAATTAALPSILRLGILRSGHELNPNNVHSATWKDKGTIGSTQNGIYLWKTAVNAAESLYDATKRLDQQPSIEVLMCSVALGCVKVQRATSNYETFKPLVNTISGAEELYLRSEDQVYVTHVLKLQIVPSVFSSQSGEKSFTVLRDKLLGRGVSGEVFLAMMYPARRPVACKIICHQGDMNCKYEVERELQVMVQLEGYRHVVSALHYHCSDHYAFLFTELMQCSLQDLSKEGPLSEDCVIRYFLEAARGLESLHLEGIVHCDIKPANIMIDIHGTVLLSDFGLAGNVGTKQIGGSPAYMAVEVLDPGSFEQPIPATARDIWALAASMVHLLTGKQPFSGAFKGDVVSFKKWRCSPSVQLQVPLVKNEILKHLLEKCLLRDACQRPSAREVQQELEHCNSGPSSSIMLSFKTAAATVAYAELDCNSDISFPSGPTYTNSSILQNTNSSILQNTQ